ncbi:hypothetical protein [Bradyrhizobium valentinum]|uniref:hypothetical protein n=1 Tax=Bradyrhizobium valentinum TaxID=1518501 RepID=UPI000B284485|nr:hypothetical protein [Bradyrhizobium valentinum]
MAAAAASNKRWTSDQSAMVLEITVRDREALQLWFFGADDDPHFEQRIKLKRAKGAARARKCRAARSTGRKRGRPALELSPEEMAARIREQNAERQRRRRASRKNPSRDIIDIGSVTDLSVTLPQTPILLPAPLDVRRAPQARRPPVPNEAIVMLELVEAELLPETKIVMPKQPEVIELIPIKARLAPARRQPVHPGVLERYRAQGNATFGGKL